MPTTHQLQAFNLLNAKLRGICYLDYGRDLALTFEISRQNITDLFDGDVECLFVRSPLLLVDLLFSSCYAVKIDKRFESAGDVHAYLHQRDSYDESTALVRDYGMIDADHSDRLRYWRAMLGRFTTLCNFGLETGVESLDVVCESLRLIVDPHRVVVMRHAMR